MKIIFGVTLAVALVGICSGKAVLEEYEAGVAELNKAIQLNELFYEKITNFALKLDKAITTQSEVANKENIIFSPINLVATLSLLLLGSSGETFTGLSKILDLENGFNISKKSEEFHRNFAAEVLQNIAPETDLNSALYLKEGQKLVQKFTELNKETYGSLIQEVDFAGKPEMAQEMINNYIEEKTHGLIKTFLDEPPSRDTNIIIAATAYFKDEWLELFDDGFKIEFNFAPGKITKIPAFVSSRHVNYGKNLKLDAEMIELPYKGQTSLYAILPNKKDAFNLSTFKAKLTPEILQEMIDSLRSHYCFVSLPEMKLSSKYQFSKLLKSLNAENLFNSVDLSLLNGVQKPNTTVEGLKTIDELRNAKIFAPKPMDIKDITHKVAITLNADGTEAAATSIVEIVERLGTNDPDLYVLFDRPFVFFIRDDATRAITFWGSIVDPTK